MDSVREQDHIGLRQVREDQRTTVQELVDAYCEKFGGSAAQLAEAASLDAGRFRSYLDSRGVTDLTTAEMTNFMSLCSKLEKAVK